MRAKTSKVVSGNVEAEGVIGFSRRMASFVGAVAALPCEGRWRAFQLLKREQTTIGADLSRRRKRGVEYRSQMLGLGGTRAQATLRSTMV
jgi:hypothetical protein